jgi:hypothetical protein
MATVKYKVIGSFTDRFYYSQIVDVDNSIHATNDAQIQFIEDLLYDDCLQFDPNNWKDEGSECVEYFAIDEFIIL